MSIAGTHNPILEASSELLAMIADFRFKAEQETKYENFRDNVEQALADFGERLRLQNISKENIELGRYAVTTFIDEVVMSSNWEGKLAWMAQTLQWHYFGEHRGGEGFYNRLAELRQQGVDQINLLEFYYVCLELGFQGMYRVFDQDKLVSLKQELKRLVERYRNYPNLQLSAASGQLEISTNAKTKFPYAYFGAALAGVLLVIYIGFMLAINHTANTTEMQLSHYAGNMKTLAQEQHYNGDAS
jgi:type VI secretion system protein ImpK